MAAGRKSREEAAGGGAASLDRVLRGTHLFLNC